MRSLLLVVFVVIYLRYLLFLSFFCASALFVYVCVCVLRSFWVRLGSFGLVLGIGWLGLGLHRLLVRGSDFSYPFLRSHAFYVCVRALWVCLRSFWVRLGSVWTRFGSVWVCTVC